MIVDKERKSRLAYAIRRAREKRGLTPPQLAAKLGRARGTVNDWESGVSAPSLLDLGPLCAALGVDPRLFAVLPEEPPSDVDAYLVADAALQGLSDALGRVGPLPEEPEARPRPPKRRRLRVVEDEQGSDEPKGSG